MTSTLKHSSRISSSFGAQIHQYILARSANVTMSMQVTYRRLPEYELAELEADSERAMSYIFSIPGMDLAEMASLLDDPSAMQAKGAATLAAFENAQLDPRRVDLNKDWHALHFLLTNDASLDPDHRPNNPLHNVVMGGHATAIESTYGPVRKFSRNDICEIVDALAVLTVEDLRTRFSVDAFNAAGIYPARCDWHTDDVEGAFQIFPQLRQLFEDALAKNEIVIVYAA